VDDAPNWLKTFDNFYRNEADGKIVDHMMKSLQKYYPENRAKKRWGVAHKHYHIKPGTDMGVIQGLRPVVITWSRLQQEYDNQYRPLPRLLTRLLDEIRREFDDTGTPVASCIQIIEAIVDHFLEGTVTVGCNGGSPVQSPSSQAPKFSFRCDEHVLTNLEKLAIRLERLYPAAQNQEIVQNIPEIIKKILIASSLSNTIVERWSYQQDLDLRRRKTDPQEYKNSLIEVIPVFPTTGPLL
jgi:hypothetical protein